MTTDAPATVMGQDMKADLASRLAREESPKATPTVTPPAESAVGEKPGGTGGVEDSAAKGPAATPGSPKPAPEAAAGPDLSFVDEKYRSVLAGASPEFQAYLRKEMGEGKLRFDDYTKKTTAVADERKALAEQKAALEFGQAVMSDEEALDTLRALADKRKGGKPPTTAPKIDFLTATPEEIQAHFEAIADATADAKVKAALKADEDRRAATAQATQTVETQRTEIAAEAGKAFVEMGYTIEEWGTVGEPAFERLGGWDGLAAIAKARRVEFGKDFVVGTLREFIPKKVTAPDSPHANGKAPVNAAVGASALTRGVGTAPAYNVPAFIREGRQLTNQSPQRDQIAEALYDVNQKRIAKGLPPLTL